jgi:hypothetical protein
MMTEMLARLERVFVWGVQREREREARANTGEATQRVQEARQRTSRRPALSLTFFSPVCALFRRSLISSV